MPPTHNPSTATLIGMPVEPPTQTHTHIQPHTPPPSPAEPPLSYLQKWGHNWSGHSLRRTHGTAVRKNEEPGKEKTFHFLPSMRKNKKSDSYSNYPATRRDNSKREPSLKEVQCSSLGTKDSSLKQCCCLWLVMKIGWVVESCALAIQIFFSALLSL